MNRRERRALNPEIREKAIQLKASAQIGGGYGIGNQKAISAGGQMPGVNPFMQPKSVGIDIQSQFFPPSYFVEWDYSLHRKACDQAMLMGYMSMYATLTTWTYQNSGFVRALLRKYETIITKNPIYAVNDDGSKNEEWTNEITNKTWFTNLCKEILLAKFWGCVGINFNPITGTFYKYPMQQLDPINRMLRSSTYNFTDGTSFYDNANLLFVQPSTSQEEFLGYMQTISRDFIGMNLNNSNWLQGGQRLAFPILAIGYPHNDGSVTVDSNGNIILDTNGEPVRSNPFRHQAEDLAANIDPSKAFTYPYTLDDNGKMIKSIDVDFKTPGGGKAYSVFQDFNTEKKNELREWLLGSDIMGHNPSKGGTRSLGEVHLLSWEDIQSECLESVLKILNDKNDFLRKIKLFYKSFPDNLHFDINRIREMKIEDVEAYSNILNQNGKQLTDEFFMAQGLAKEFFTDAPTEEIKPIPEKVSNNSKPSLLEGLKKKTFNILAGKKKKDPKIKKSIQDNYIKYVYDNPTGAPIYSEIYAELNDLFFNEIIAKTTIESSFLAFKNTSFFERYMLNAYQFSSAKVASESKAFQYLVYDEQKELKPYEEYYSDASKVADIVNDTWLRTEYDNCSRSAVMAEEWSKLEENKDLYPYWVFRNTPEHGIDDECDPLNDVVFRIGDDNADSCCPPLHFNCQCFIEPVDEIDIKDNNYKVASESQAKDFLENNVAEGFRFNPGLGTMPNSGGYFEDLSSANKSDYKLFDIPPISNKYLHAEYFDTKGMQGMMNIFQKWREKYMVNKNHQIVFQNKKTFANVTFDDISFHNIEKNFRGFDLLPETIKQPDEIWSYWVNPSAQKDVLRNYINIGNINYVVQTKNGHVENAFAVPKSGLSKYRKGVILL